MEKCYREITGNYKKDFPVQAKGNKWYTDVIDDLRAEGKITPREYITVLRTERRAG